LKVSSQLPAIVSQTFHTQDNLRNTTVNPLKSLTNANSASPPSSIRIPMTKKSNLGDIQPAHELIESGYREVTKSMRAGKARGAAISAGRDFYKNIPEIGLLNANAGPKKGTAAVSIELSSIRRDTITMMNSMPAEINVEIADEIRDQIVKNEWPVDKHTINARIKEISNALIAGRSPKT